jgi:outer membrane protein assembly factor BamB
MRMLIAAASLLCAIPCATAEHWPNWRGPTNNGISGEKSVPVEWSVNPGQHKNVVWSAPLPGPAGASPIVWNDQVFLTSVTAAGELVLIGREEWRRNVSGGNKDARGDEGNSASPSPVTDGEHVWSFMGTGDLACFDFSGREVWKLNLQTRYGKFNIQFGMTSTPVIDGDVLYFQLIHGDGNPATREARVVAINKRTGAEIWRVERPSDGKAENEHSYASPIRRRAKVSDHARLRLRRRASVE